MKKKAIVKAGNMEERDFINWLLKQREVLEQIEVD